jgi:hypothetical protein
VNAKDRKYQIWERNPKNIEIENELIFAQKLEYMHNNPLKKNGNYVQVQLSISFLLQNFMKQV